MNGVAADNCAEKQNKRSIEMRKKRRNEEYKS